MKHYIKSRIFEYIACLCVCMGVIYPVCAGFTLDTPLYDVPPLGIIAGAAILAVIYLFAFKRQSVFAGCGVLAALAAAVIIYIRTFSPLEDEEGSSVFIFLLVSVIVCLLSFLLTRSMAGTIAAAILGSFIYAGSRFLMFPVGLWPYIVLLMGCAVMLFLRVHNRAVLRAISGSVKTGRYFIQSLIMAGAALLMAAGLFFAVIRPLNLPVYDLQLISLLRNMDILEVFGTAAEREVYDPELSGGRILDGSEYADTEEEERETEDADAEENRLQNSSLIMQLQGVAYNIREKSRAWMLAIPAALIALIFIMRVVIKKIWRSKVRALPKEDGASAYYRFFLSRFARIGYTRADNVTLPEYARSMSRQLEPYADGTCTFEELTWIYSKVYYGSENITGEEYDKFESFYDRFFKNMRKDIGVWKYILKIFRI